jgi:hypothetical protein
VPEQHFGFGVRDRQQLDAPVVEEPSRRVDLHVLAVERRRAQTDKASRLHARVHAHDTSSCHWVGGDGALCGAL